MLGKSLFGHSGSGSSGSGGSQSEVSLVDGKLIYEAIPDVLIEEGKVYFADSEPNAGISLVEGRLYAEEVVFT